MSHKRAGERVNREISIEMFDEEKSPDNFDNETNVGNRLFEQTGERANCGMGTEMCDEE